MCLSLGKLNSKPHAHISKVTDNKPKIHFMEYMELGQGWRSGVRGAGGSSRPGTEFLHPGPFQKISHVLQICLIGIFSPARLVACESPLSCTFSSMSLQNLTLLHPPRPLYMLCFLPGLLLIFLFNEDSDLGCCL